MSATVPDPLKSDTPEARLIRQKIWNRLWLENSHFMGGIVGREGSGKSYTGLKLCEVVDPSFNAQRVMFEPAAFLERLREWKADGETQGKMVLADESGVGLGVRTWYEKDQIKFNQVLQVIRDENMGMLFTLPRLNELDSQARGRLHSFIEMTDMEPGEWAEFKWLNWSPTRDERDKIYREYPKLRFDDHVRQLRRLRVSPPSAELVEEYERRKSEFQAELYGEALDEMRDDDDGLEPKEVVEQLQDGDDLAAVVSEHGNTGEPYIDSDLIEVEYGLSARDAKKVKKLAERSDDIDISSLT